MQHWWWNVSLMVQFVVDDAMRRWWCYSSYFMGQFVVAVRVVRHCTNLTSNLSASLRSNLSMSMGWGEPNPVFFLIYARKTNVSYTSILQRFKKTTDFINAVCVIYEFTVKKRGRYLDEYLNCRCFYYTIKSVQTTCFFVFE